MSSSSLLGQEVWRPGLDPDDGRGAGARREPSPLSCCRTYKALNLHICVISSITKWIWRTQTRALGRDKTRWWNDGCPWCTGRHRQPERSDERQHSLLRHLNNRRACIEAWQLIDALWLSHVRSREFSAHARLPCITPACMRKIWRHLATRWLPREYGGYLIDLTISHTTADARESAQRFRSRRAEPDSWPTSSTNSPRGGVRRSTGGRQ